MAVGDYTFFSGSLAAGTSVDLRPTGNGVWMVLSSFVDANTVSYAGDDKNDISLNVVSGASSQRFQADFQVAPNNTGQNNSARWMVPVKILIQKEGTEEVYLRFSTSRRITNTFYYYLVLIQVG